MLAGSSAKIGAKACNTLQGAATLCTITLMRSFERKTPSPLGAQAEIVQTFAHIILIGLLRKLMLYCARYRSRHGRAMLCYGFAGYALAQRKDKNIKAMLLLQHRFALHLSFCFAFVK